MIYLPIDSLFPHPDNPRKDLGDLTELADSIKAKGIMQNLTVVPFVSKTNPNFNGAGRYTIVIGHRRHAAAKLAGLTELPCVIVDMDYHDQIATMLLENMQRSDLTVYEQAKGFQMMLDLGESVESVSEKSGFSQSTIRRRVKLLELDEKKFQEAEARGATLFEYMELDKIKDLELKNEVLKSIGTENFRYKLRSAIEKEENKEYLDFVEAEVSKFAAKITNSKGYSWHCQYSTYIKKNKIMPPDDCKTVKYFYRRDDWSIALYVADDEAKKTANEQEAQERLAREEKRQERIAKLSAVSKRAYELRREFCDSVTATAIKKNFAEIIAFWMYAHVQDEASWVKYRDALAILGIPVDEDCEDDSSYAYDDVLNAVKKGPEIMFWKMTCLQGVDDEGMAYFHPRFGRHEDNDGLTAWYDLLIKLGYKMSDEEKALRDGTHELFAIDESGAEQ